MTKLPELEAEIKKRLLAAASQTVQYVAYGDVLRQELSKTHNVPESLVRTLLDQYCRDLCCGIEKL